MDPLEVKLIGEMFAPDYPQFSREVILLAVMKVLRAERPRNLASFRAALEAEMKRIHEVSGHSSHRKGGEELGEQKPPPHGLN